jgi:hypothetical protein
MSGFDVAVWGWPQWAMAIVYALMVITHAVLDGRPRSGNYQFSVAVIGAAFGVGTLWAGGFWA